MTLSKRFWALYLILSVCLFGTPSIVTWRILPAKAYSKRKPSPCLFLEAVQNTSKLLTCCGINYLKLRFLTNMMNDYPQTELKTSDAGNLKSPPRRVIVKRILKAREESTPELVSRSFKVCALNISVDERKDNAIHCFKAGQPCEKAFQCSKISCQP